MLLSLLLRSLSVTTVVRQSPVPLVCLSLGVHVLLPFPYSVNGQLPTNPLYYETPPAHVDQYRTLAHFLAAYDRSTIVPLCRTPPSPTVNHQLTTQINYFRRPGRLPDWIYCYVLYRYFRSVGTGDNHEDQLHQSDPDSVVADLLRFTTELSLVPVAAVSAADLRASMTAWVRQWNAETGHIPDHKWVAFRGLNAPVQFFKNQDQCFRTRAAVFRVGGRNRSSAGKSKSKSDSQPITLARAAMTVHAIFRWYRRLVATKSDLSRVRLLFEGTDQKLAELAVKGREEGSQSLQAFTLVAHFVRHLFWTSVGHECRASQIKRWFEVDRADHRPADRYPERVPEGNIGQQYHHKQQQPQPQQPQVDDSSSSDYSSDSDDDDDEDEEDADLSPNRIVGDVSGPGRSSSSIGNSGAQRPNSPTSSVVSGGYSGGDGYHLQQYPLQQQQQQQYPQPAATASGYSGGSGHWQQYPQQAMASGIGGNSQLYQPSQASHWEGGPIIVSNYHNQMQLYPQPQSYPQVYDSGGGAIYGQNQAWSQQQYNYGGYDVGAQVTDQQSWQQQHHQQQQQSQPYSNPNQWYPQAFQHSDQSYPVGNQQPPHFQSGNHDNGNANPRGTNQASSALQQFYANFNPDFDEIPNTDGFGEAGNNGHNRGATGDERARKETQV